VAQIEGGIVLELPESNIEAFLKEHLDLQLISSDEDLINHLENVIS
jgi:hypothetical protein